MICMTYDVGVLLVVRSLYKVEFRNDDIYLCEVFLFSCLQDFFWMVLKFNANKVAPKWPITRSSRAKVAIKYNVFTNGSHITALIHLQRWLMMNASMCLSN